MSAISRRALLGASAAAGAMGFPTAVEAGLPAPHPDAELFALIDRAHAARSAWDMSFPPMDAAKERAKALYSPRPDALQFGARDLCYALGPASAHEPLPNGRFRGLYTERDVERLRAGPPVTRWADVADDHPEPHPRELDPIGEATGDHRGARRVDGGPARSRP